MADLCEKEGIEFILGHACYMKSIDAGKAKIQDPQLYHLLKSVTGIGEVLALTFMYEVQDIHSTLAQRLPITSRLNGRSGGTA